MSKRNLGLFILVLTLVVSGWLLFVKNTALAANKQPCASPAAPWNQGLAPGFGCHCVQDPPCQYPYDSGNNCNSVDRRDYTIVKWQTSSCSCGSACQTRDQDKNGVLPVHCRCVRQADCWESGGKCIVNGQELVIETRGASIKITTKPVATEVLSKWQKTSYRCPLDDASVCYLPPKEEPAKPKTPATSTTTKPSLPTTEQSTTTSQTPPRTTANINISECCRDIVPRIDHYTQDYSLNHLVQVAINIYECILCIVGALILLMLIAGAITLMASGGSEERVKLGRKIITAAVIGGIIVFASFLIVNFTVKALGGSFVGNEEKIQINSGQ